MRAEKQREKTAKRQARKLAGKNEEPQESLEPQEPQADQPADEQSQAGYQE
jgi:hypothetical protein